MSDTVDNSDHIYDEFSRLLFLHSHRELSGLVNELPEKSGQFRFLRHTSLYNLKGSEGLIWATTSDMIISIPLDLSTRPLIPRPCFIRSRCPTPLVVPSLVFFPSVLYLCGPYWLFIEDFYRVFNSSDSVQRSM
jgi:hypothetical protein